VSGALELESSLQAVKAKDEAIAIAQRPFGRLRDLVFLFLKRFIWFPFGL
jgi:hypothetical protein